jgi:hypothetical protein
VPAVALTAPLRRALRTTPPETKGTLAWLLPGAVLATLPGAAGIPGDRVLFLPNLGIVSALALVLLRAGGVTRGRAAPEGAALPDRLGVGLLALFHVVLAPLVFAIGGAQLASSSHAALALASKADIPAREGVEVAGIGLSDPLVGMYLGSSLWMAPRPEPRPRAAWIARILDDVEGRPTRFLVTFDRSADDPSLALVVWQDGELRAFRPPAQGDEVLVKHQSGPMGI